jgi:hypothetical protein
MAQVMEEDQTQDPQDCFCYFGLGYSFHVLTYVRELLDVRLG